MPHLTKALARQVILGALCTGAFATSAEATTYWYVNTAASGGNGTSWGQAFRYPQEALEAAALSGGADEIWVAQGTYYPPDGMSNPPSNAREASFELQSGVAIYGGFDATETTRAQRNPEKNTTILSGDIGTPGTASDNSYHVVTAQSVGITAILSGFTITKGTATDTYGGGMYVYDSTPQVNRCVFLSNTSPSSGHPGGALAIFSSSSKDPARFVNCSFLSNSGSNHGGGVLISGSETNPAFDNCVFAGNSVSGSHGGAVGIIEDAIAVFTNCTFSANAAPDQGGAFSIHGDSFLQITNCIVWGNCPEENQIDVESEDADVYVTYSDIQGGWSGTGNINQDPLFCDGLGPDETECNDRSVDSLGVVAWGR